MRPVEPPTPPATVPPSAPIPETVPPPVPSSASPFQRMQQEGAFQGERVYTGPEGPGSLGNTLKQVERRVATKGLPAGMSERRMTELQQKFGGTQGAPSPSSPPNPVAANRGTRRAAAASSPAFDLNSLTPEERIQGETWLRQGIPADVILQRIKLSRQFTGTLNTATPEEAAREVERMVRKAAARKSR